MSETSGEARAATDPAATDPDGGVATDTIDPTPPEEFVEAAKLAPDHWLYLIDPTWSEEGPPPEWAVVGQWRSDAEGEIVEWQDNEDYRPSPSAMGWPEPADEVDAAIQLATTGYGPADDVTKALAKAEVAVLTTADGDPVRAAAPDGTPVVLVYSSPKYLHLAGRLSFETVRIPDFQDRIPEGHSLCINSSGPVSMVMTTDGLDDVLTAAATDSEDGTQEAAQSADGPGSGSADWAQTAGPGAVATESAQVDGSVNGGGPDGSDTGADGIVDLPLPEGDTRSRAEPASGTSGEPAAEAAAETEPGSKPARGKKRKTDTTEE
ncbi:type VII secretion system-associated protein [Streptomyces sp. AA1529]|uniref:type VII secretion system-associated protein n=1 Tax=Streptomyces sp. AA1529 TaxID=1203257 RepID=UPI003D703804